MKSRVEHECLSGNHRNPSYFDERESDMPSGAHKEIQDETNCVQSTSPGADKQRPKVETASSSEGEKYRQIKLDDENPGNGSGSRKDTVIKRRIGKGRAFNDEIQHRDCQVSE